ncbi:MAG: glycosyltransferase family 2 protein [Candidatus Kapabacteria bacterium]|nr:glycosyltransferase family 2 protein [Ignavibacteriota bacterium]MCW5885756.1 glycosyltransferase family 2 protein [Candidatus Kapabacteria bacterium]
MFPVENIIMIVYFLSLSVLFGFGIHGLVLLYYYRKTFNHHLPYEIMPDAVPMVTVQLPLYNEMFVVERLIKSVCEIEYPKDKLEIQVLDDSTDDTVKMTKEIVNAYKSNGVNIKYIHRENRIGYKAGALKYGLECAEGEFVAIFDADFVPKPDFLMKTIPHFNNPEIGMVQTRWEHLNEEYSYLTKAQALALDGHFVLEQQVRNKAGFFINFNGTAGIWRKSTIFDAGNWQADTLTEDLDLSYRAQLRGWKFRYLNDVTSPAELPADINALKTQQFRWTKGAVETAKKILPMVLKSNLPIKMKLESFIHLTSNIVFPFIIIVALLNVPLVIIKNTVGGFDQFYSLMSIFVLASVSTFLFYTYAQKAIHLDWRKRLLLFPVFLAGSMGFAVNNTKAVIEALIGKKSGFARTPKDGMIGKQTINRKVSYKMKRISAVVVLELLLTLYFVAGIIISAFYLEIAAMPFQLLFLMGFGTVGYMSLRHALTR